MGKKSLSQFIEKVGADEKFFNGFIAAIRGGNNTLKHNLVAQTVSLDDTWILTIESALYSIEQIVRNPRKFIAENELIVDVAKARRVNSKTVRHLSSHSQYVQNIDKEGEVRPKKLLTVELDEDLAIYENRFICALVNRLIIFVEQRYNELNGRMDVFEQTNLSMESEFKYGDTEFKCDINMNVKEPPKDKSRVNVNKELFEKIDLIRRRLRVLQATDFIRSLSSLKPVRPPIQKTNLLTKNVDYSNCYKLWLFISSYTYLGYSVEVMDKELPLNSDYFDDLAIIAGLSTQSLITDNVINRERYDEIEFSEPEEKDFNLVTQYRFEPKFNDSNEKAGVESVNEYYFRKMKDELTALVEEDDVVVEKQLDMNFPRFFRSISRINDELYNDLIEQKLSANVDMTQKSPIQKRQQEIKQQQERIKRRALLLKLKWEDLEKAQRMQERAQNKLEKMKEDLEKEKQKQRDKVKNVKKTVVKSKVKVIKVHPDGKK